MAELYQEKCVACRRDSPLRNPGRSQRAAPYRVRLGNAGRLRYPQAGPGFPLFQLPAGLDFTNSVGSLAEAEGHHPRIVTEWGRVGVTWWTHKIRNLHRNDFIMAAKTDKLYEEVAAE